ncbi:MAG TPA: hypothetical protein VK862_09175 [Afifellaceae bacterium]|nr:hypothetical protein [Afifellaceae bacterium]
MYARVTKYRMKPEAMNDSIALLEQLKPEIMALPGMIQFINVANEDGNGYVVALVESKEVSDANKDRVAQIWARFTDFLADFPEPAGYNVLMCETAG